MGLTLSIFVSVVPLWMSICIVEEGVAAHMTGLLWRQERRRAKLAVRVLLTLRHITRHARDRSPRELHPDGDGAGGTPPTRSAYRDDSSLNCSDLDSVNDLCAMERDINRTLDDIVQVIASCVCMCMCVWYHLFHIQTKFCDDFCFMLEIIGYDRTVARGTVVRLCLVEE